MHKGGINVIISPLIEYCHKKVKILSRGILYDTVILWGNAPPKSGIKLQIICECVGVKTRQM
jgi:hypothetical protein